MHLRLAAALLAVAAATGQTVGAREDERLQALIDEALDRNPRVRQAFADYEAARHRIPQVSALPDPTVSLMQYARSVETRVGGWERTVTFSQRIPGFGKRATKGEAAAKAAQSMDAIYQAARADVAWRVRRAYYELGFVDRAVELNVEDTGLVEHFEDMARDRYAQGFGIQADVVRLQASITQTRNRRETLKRRRIDLEAALNALRDRPADTPVGRIALAPIPAPALDSGAIAAIGRRHEPELRAAFLRLEEKEKGIHLARLQFRPDFTAGVTWGNILARAGVPAMPVPGNGKDVYAVTLGMTLPIFRKKHDAGVRAATASYAAAREAYRSQANDMEASVRALTFHLQTIGGQIKLFEDTLVPQAERAFASTQEAYANGSLAVIDLLDVQRTLLEVRLGLARLEADYWNALADLERAIGHAVPEEDTP